MIPCFYNGSAAATFPLDVQLIIPKIMYSLKKAHQGKYNKWKRLQIVGQ